MYIYIYMHIYIYIHIYTYIHIHLYIDNRIQHVGQSDDCMLSASHQDVSIPDVDLSGRHRSYISMNYITNIMYYMIILHSS